MYCKVEDWSGSRRAGSMSQTSNRNRHLYDAPHVDESRHLVMTQPPTLDRRVRRSSYMTLHAMNTHPKGYSLPTTSTAAVFDVLQHDSGTQSARLPMTRMGLGCKEGGWLSRYTLSTLNQHAQYPSPDAPPTISTTCRQHRNVHFNACPWARQRQ
ncbi:hypothetical protein BDZ97DRAFT_1825028 [Flammula alnicola]|nr:hypothetical protein BDZ97DRAFT_1825028 [Flammula alnicola]